MNNAEMEKVQLTQEEIEYFASQGGITHFDNEGNAVITNRAARRKRPKTDPKYTKATHSLKLKRASSKKKARKNK